jgi:predicted nuclease of restriction endonuclease-like (RecB) superfamily
MATPALFSLSFEQLVLAIGQVHAELAAQASRAVNTSLTLRNWLIGCYIAEYELNGSDRAAYGDKVLSALAGRLHDVSNCNRRQLYDYLRFYRTYPQIVQTLSAQLRQLLPLSKLDQFEKVPTPSAQLKLASDTLLSRLSYSMFKLLVGLNDATKRSFYEVESIQGSWTVRELKRQIHSLYYERSGLSRDKQKLSRLTHQQAERQGPLLDIRDPYLFEFIGLKSKEVMGESQLEDLLIDKLEDFLLELGHGFCFEARQKRILIGDEYYFVDLVFYHRILKCHVLVELKLAEFSHENIGQLNTYVSWYRKCMMREDDNPPIGILLCTHKNHSLVEFALAGIDNQLFVSKYLLELPKKEEMERFIEEQLAAGDSGNADSPQTMGMETSDDEGGN